MVVVVVTQQQLEFLHFKAEKVPPKPEKPAPVSAGSTHTHHSLLSVSAGRLKVLEHPGMNGEELSTTKVGERVLGEPLEDRW